MGDNLTSAFPFELAIAIFGNLVMTKMSLELSLYMTIQRMCVWEGSLKSPLLFELTMGRSLVIEL